MTLYMQSTKIEASRTAADIQSLLVRFGARQIMTEIDKDGEVTSLTFSVEVSGNLIPYKLPARIEPVFELLQAMRTVRNRSNKVEQDWDQAKRVAWRLLLRWLQSQLALIDTGMVSTAEVMTPWILLKDGKMLFEHICNEGLGKLLPATV